MSQDYNSKNDCNYDKTRITSFVGFIFVFLFLIPLLLTSVFSASCGRNTSEYSEWGIEDSISVIVNGLDTDKYNIEIYASMKDIKVTKIDLDSKKLEAYANYKKASKHPIAYPFTLPIDSDQLALNSKELAVSSALTPIQKVVSGLKNSGPSISIVELNIRGSNYVFLLDEESPVSIIGKCIIQEKRLNVINEFVILVDNRDSVVNDDEELNHRVDSVDMVFILNDKFHVRSIENTRESVYQLTGKKIHGIIGADILHRKERLLDAN